MFFGVLGMIGFIIFLFGGCLFAGGALR